MSIRFDSGTDRLLNTSPIGIGPTDLYTVGFWMYLASDSNFYNGLWGVNTNDSANNFNLDTIILDIDGTTLGSYVGNHLDSGFSSGGTSLSLSTWYYISGVRDAMNSFKVYRNAVLDTTNSYDCTGRTAAFTREEIANLYSIDLAAYNGRIFNFMRWNRVFTARDLNVQMRQFEPIYPGDLRLWTPMKDRGTTARKNDVVKGNYWTIGGTLADEADPTTVVRVRRSFFLPFYVSPSSSAVDLVVQDATHTHAADAIALTVSAYLAVTDATHTHAADGIALTAQSSLTVQDATHEHAADGITLSLAVGLTIQDATHDHAVDAIGLTVSTVLAVTDATHTHAADAIALTVSAYLAVTDAAHEHTADAIELTVNPTLAVDDATHTHAADAIALTAQSTLSVQDATHPHIADPITLTTEGQTTLTVQDATHVHAADEISLSALSYLAVTDAEHLHVVDGITVTANAYLAVTEATHDHAVDSIALIVSAYIEVLEATHVHVVDGIALTIEGQVLLTVQDATHEHMVDVVVLSTRPIFHLRYNEPYPFYPND